MKTIKGILCGLFLVIVLGFTAGASHLSIDTVTLTVAGKERINTQDVSYYLVFSDKGPFKNDDDLWQLKFDSSELQAELKEGVTYLCTKNYWRVSFLSMYENLLKCSEVK